VAMAIFMLSLAGVPPMVGFFGKLYVFSAAVSAGFTWLAVFGVLNSVVSAYYYLRVVVTMFMSESTEASYVRSVIPAGAATAIALAVLGVLLQGLFANPWFVTLSQAIVSLK